MDSVDVFMITLVAVVSLVVGGAIGVDSELELVFKECTIKGEANLGGARIECKPKTEKKGD
jgi:hypothetical protein